MQHYCTISVLQLRMYEQNLLWYCIKMCQYHSRKYPLIDVGSPVCSGLSKLHQNRRIIRQRARRTCRRA